MNADHSLTFPLRAGTYLLRPLVPADAPAMAAAVRASMDGLGPWMPWAHAEFSDAEALDWIAYCVAARADGSAYELGIFRQHDADGPADPVYVGNAGLNQFNRAHRFCNLGYWVRTSAQRQGAGFAAIQALARFAFGQLAQARVEIVVADGNAASLALARKAGAVHEGVARNRLHLHDGPTAAHMLSLVP